MTVLRLSRFIKPDFRTTKSNSLRRRAVRAEPRLRGKKCGKRGNVPVGQFCGDRRHNLARVVLPLTRPPIAQLLGQIGCVLSLQQRRVRPFALRVVVTGTAARDAGSRVTVLKELGASTPFFSVRLERPIGRRRRKACKIGAVLARSSSPISDALACIWPPSLLRRPSRKSRA